MRGSQPGCRHITWFCTEQLSISTMNINGPISERGVVCTQTDRERKPSRSVVAARTYTTHYRQYHESKRAVS